MHPAPEEYTFGQADAIVHFAEAHNMKVRGHNFCWHRALPSWVTQNITRENAEQVLREHIATVAGRYRGKVQSWDVVNEAIQLRDNMPNGFRNSFWYSTLGTAYMDIAFDAAHLADPNVILTYNDFGLEYENRADNAKRKAVLAMLRDLKKRGVPVQALGMQSHLRAGTGEDFGGNLTHFIAEVHDLGLKVYVTELDVDDSHLSVEGIARDAAIADVYQRYLDLVLGTGCVSTVITWGAWDLAKPTGAENVSAPSAQKPLLFGQDSLPKLDAFAVARSIRDSPAQR